MGKMYQIQSGVLVDITPKVANVGMDGAFAANMAMPSDRYDDVLWKASGVANKYTASADGYVFCSRTSTANNQFIYAVVFTLIGAVLYETVMFVPTSGAVARLFFPIRKGSQYAFVFSAPTAGYNRFIYAEGSY